MSTQYDATVARYMEIRSASNPVYSHDNRSMYFLATITGIPQVWSLDEGIPWPRQVTFFPERVMGVYPSPTMDVLCVSTDQGGSENAQLFLTNGFGADPKDLTDDPSHIYAFGAWAPDGRRLSYASNRRNGKDFDVYIYDLASDEHTLIHSSDHTNFAGPFSRDGKYVIISRHYKSLSNDLFLVNVETGELTLLTPHEGDVSFHAPCFSSDGRYLYLLSNKDSEFTRVARIELNNQEWLWITDDQWDAETLRLSPDGRYIAYSLNVDGTSQLVVRDLAEGTSPAGEPVGQLPKLPSGVIEDVNWSTSGYTIAITLSSPRYAVDIWTIDVETNALCRATYASISGVPSEQFVEPELVHYTSFDGLSIPAFYYKPKHSEGPYRVVVYVHGGPESQFRNSFNPILQHLIAEGFAVFAPNVRGSSGYGRTYVHLDDVRKRMDSVADLAKAVEWLVAHGNANKDAIAVMGRSYGGFMVLAAVTHYPDLWAAAVDIVGIANLRTFIENTSPYRRHLRESEYGTIEHDGDFFDQISPIHHVDKIKAPMFISHGANDPRVPVGEAEQMVQALRARNHPVEYVRFEDEGHGIVRLENRITAYSSIAAFLHRFLD